MKKLLIVCSALLLACSAQEILEEPFVPTERLLLLRGNFLLEDEVARFSELMDRAKQAGFTDIVLSDGKINNWFASDYGTKWHTHVKELRSKAKDLNLDVHLAVLPYGYCGSILAHNPNLAEGTPIDKAPFKAVDGSLRPIMTASLENASFEVFDGNRAESWNLQDDPGQASFIDTQVKKSGTASLRFSNLSAANPYGHGRIMQELEVEPFKQYRLNAWIRMENFSARQVNALVKTEAGQSLLSQTLQLDNEQGKPSYTERLSNKTLSWTKVSWVFNSLDNSEVKLMIGVWGGEAGDIWFDDLSLEDVPGLNLLRRDDLPITLESETQVFQETIDFLPIKDTLLGTVPYAGKYSLTHAPMSLVLTEDSKIQEGEHVYLSGYHALVVPNGHVSCSLLHEDVFKLAERITKEALSFSPEGFLLMHSEIRSAGWEPEQTSYEPTGKLLSMNIKRTYESIKSHSPEKPVYMWGDMIDPFHNAKEHYYQVRGNLERSWEDLPKELRIITWWSGENLAEHGKESLEFFSKQGFKQILGAYYNDDVLENYQHWQKASQGITGIEGVMFASWNDDYSDLERFADLWWGDD